MLQLQILLYLRMMQAQRKNWDIVKLDVLI